MKFGLSLLLMLFAAVCVMGQSIDDILERDPFDPDRGAVEEEEPVEEEVTILNPAEKPVLDGTIIVGDLKMAMVTVRVEGRYESRRLRLNDEVDGYTLSNVDRNFIELTRAGGVLKLEMFNGEKEKRGGSARPRSRPPSRASGKDEPRVISGKSVAEPDPENNVAERNEDEDDKADRSRPRPRTNTPSAQRLKELREKARKLTEGKF